MRISDWSSDVCSSDLHNYPADVEPGLDETAFYDPLNFTYPAGVHICEVEIDPATGITEVVDWVAVDDFGKVINPMVVEGQVHGGIAQGVGQAMLERSEEHTSELQSLMRISYAVFCLKKNKNKLNEQEHNSRSDKSH